MWRFKVCSITYTNTNIDVIAIFISNAKEKIKHALDLIFCIQKMHTYIFFHYELLILVIFIQHHSVVPLSIILYFVLFIIIFVPKSVPIRNLGFHWSNDDRVNRRNKVLFFEIYFWKKAWKLCLSQISLYAIFNLHYFIKNIPVC